MLSGKPGLVQVALHDIAGQAVVPEPDFGHLRHKCGQAGIIRVIVCSGRQDGDGATRIFGREDKAGACAGEPSRFAPEFDRAEQNMEGLGGVWHVREALCRRVEQGVGAGAGFVEHHAPPRQIVVDGCDIGAVGLTGANDVVMRPGWAVLIDVGPQIPFIEAPPMHCDPVDVGHVLILS